MDHALDSFRSIEAGMSSSSGIGTPRNGQFFFQSRLRLASHKSFKARPNTCLVNYGPSYRQNGRTTVVTDHFIKNSNKLHSEKGHRSAFTRQEALESYYTWSFKMMYNSTISNPLLGLRRYVIHRTWDPIVIDKCSTLSNDWRRFICPTESRSNLDNIKPFLQLIQGLSNFDGIGGNTTRVTHWFINLARDAATHIRRPRRGEESSVIEFDNMLFPLISGFDLGVDVLDVIGLNLSNCVGDPPTLHRDGCGAIAQERRAMWTIYVEHIGIATDGGAEVGFRSWNPFLLELSAADTLQPELGHDAGNNILCLLALVLSSWSVKWNLQIQLR